jgi:hypothetical protein
MEAITWKYLRSLTKPVTDLEKVKQICAAFRESSIIGPYTIDSNGVVNVEGSGVFLYYCKLKSLPVYFGTVSGDFCLNGNKLTSLEGAPHTVGRSFDVSENLLTSLAGSPKTVGEYFMCDKNKLKSLDGITKKIGRKIFSDFKQ